MTSAERPRERNCGEKISTTPATPSVAPSSARGAIGVPNHSRAPSRLKNTIAENTIATMPEGR